MSKRIFIDIEIEKFDLSTLYPDKVKAVVMVNLCNNDMKIIPTEGLTEKELMQILVERLNEGQPVFRIGC